METKLQGLLARELCAEGSTYKKLSLVVGLYAVVGKRCKQELRYGLNYRVTHYVDFFWITEAAGTVGVGQR